MGYPSLDTLVLSAMFMNRNEDLTNSASTATSLSLSLSPPSLSLALDCVCVCAPACVAVRLCLYMNSSEQKPTVIYYSTINIT